MASVREASSPSPPPVDPLSPRAIQPEDEAPAEGPTLDEDGLPPNPARRSSVRSPCGGLRVSTIPSVPCAAATALVGGRTRRLLGVPPQRAPRGLFVWTPDPKTPVDFPHKHVNKGL